MKTISRSHSSSLFLLELVVAIIIFALASAISLQFFAKAHLLNKNAKTLNYFSNESSIVAEITGISSSTEEFKKALLQVYPSATLENQTIELYYDDNLTLCSEENGTYLYTISYRTYDNFLITTMEVVEIISDTLLYQLESKHFQGGVTI